MGVGWVCVRERERDTLDYLTVLTAWHVLLDSCSIAPSVALTMKYTGSLATVSLWKLYSYIHQFTASIRAYTMHALQL